MNKLIKSPNKGQTLAEFALTLPVLFLLVMTIVDLSRVAYCYSVVFNTAREGARYGAAVVDATPGDIILAAKRLASGLDVDVTIYKTEDKIQVEAGYTFKPATPILWELIGKTSIRLRSKASMQLEE